MFELVSVGNLSTRGALALYEKVRPVDSVPYARTPPAMALPMFKTFDNLIHITNSLIDLTAPPRVKKVVQSLPPSLQGHTFPKPKMNWMYGSVIIIFPTYVWVMMINKSVTMPKPLNSILLKSTVLISFQLLEYSTFIAFTTSFRIADRHHWYMKNVER